MKNKVFIAAITLLLIVNAAVAQGRYGADSVNCLQNLSLYTDYAKQKNYKEAYPFWKQAMITCPPNASVNFYVSGVSIMRDRINNTTDPALRKGLIDTLLSLYDLRMANFPKSDFADLYDRKAHDMMAYTPDDKEAILSTFLKVIDIAGEKTDASILVLSMKMTTEQYQEGKLPAEDVMAFYTKVSKFADAQVKANPALEKLQTAQQDIDKLFVSSGVASCDNLIALFGPRFKANPTDKDLIITIVKLFGQNDCVQNDLYIQAAEAYYKMEPSAGSAYALAKMNFGKEDYQRCVECYRDAVKLGSGNDTISQYLVEMGNVYLRYMNDVSHAMSIAREAISKNAQNGKAYMLLATTWAMQKCGSDEIERKSIFWVAVDYFQKAKQVDPSLATEANKSIAVYIQYFPLQTEAFMYDLMDGNSYTVNCNGMTERTTVRTRK